MADNMDYAPIGGLKQTAWSDHAKTVLSAHTVSADNVHYPNQNSSEVRNPPVGGVTGDVTGHARTYGDVLAPWTCEDCPDPYSAVRELQSGEMWLMAMTKQDKLGTPWGSIFSHTGWSDEYLITAWPDRCRECDNRFRKHKRTSNAIRAVFYHPARMYKHEDTWCYVPGTDYKFIKLITLNHPTAVLNFENGNAPMLGSEASAEGGDLSPSPDVLTTWANQVLAELKEKFRRKRKLVFWKDNILYGRYFAEVTWRVHYADGTTFPQGEKGCQWMPSPKELDGAIAVTIHPHLHVIACGEFLDLNETTDWWDYSTHVTSADRWMVCKDYLTKYVNKQQLAGRHQATFGKCANKYLHEKTL